VGEKNGPILAVTTILTSLFVSAWIHWSGATPNLYSDLLGSFWTRCWVQSGSLPYLSSSAGCDSSFEYPVVAGMILYFARVIGSDMQTFYEAFSAFTLVAGVGVAWGCWAIAKKLGKELNPLFFLMPSFIIYGIYNFDIIFVSFVILSLLSFVVGRRSLSAALLALSVCTKLTSVVLVPVLLIELGTNRERLNYLGVFTAALLILNLPIALLNFSNFLKGYQFLANWGLEDAWYVWIFQNPATWGYAKLFGLGVSGLLLLRVYTLKASLMAKSFLAVSAYLLGTYIYAPQFNLLVIPLIALLDLQHPALYPWDGFNVMIILTWFIPNSQPTLAWQWPQLFALLRAACLAWLCISVAAREGFSLPTWVKERVWQATGRPNALGPPSTG
jgi:hypothetical protein